MAGCASRQERVVGIRVEAREVVSGEFRYGLCDELSFIVVSVGIFASRLNIHSSLYLDPRLLQPAGESARATEEVDGVNFGFTITGVRVHGWRF